MHKPIRLWGVLRSVKIGIIQGLPPFEGLSGFVKKSSPVWVFSLNHDLILQLLAVHCGIPFRDGFWPEKTSVFLTSWECWECAGLRYASEGGALRLRPLPIVLEGRLFVIRENSLRPESCWPYVFVNPLDVKSILFLACFIRVR
jgi:hypothetical protein